MGAGQNPASVPEAVRKSAVMSTTAVPDGDPLVRRAGSMRSRRSRPQATRGACAHGEHATQGSGEGAQTAASSSVHTGTCGGFETGRGPEPEHREGPRGLSARDAVKKIRGELPNDTRRAKAGDIFEIPPQRGRAYPAFFRKKRSFNVTKLLIIGGFLGSGKTSVILQMAKHLVGENPDKAAKVVILENEIGQVSIDDRTLAGAGLDVEPMFSGCVCCTMAGEMVVNVRSILDRLNPDWIILETTGMAYPNKVKAALAESIPDLTCSICCLADAKRWRRLQAVEQLAEFSREQLEGAKLVLINKSDLVDGDVLAQIDASIRESNSSARLFHVSALNGIPDEVWAQIFDGEAQI